VLSGYATCEDFTQDVATALRNLALNNIEQKLEYDHCYYYIFAAEHAVASDTKGEAMSGGEDSYGKNNQVEGVDEADIVKSNGRYTIFVHGDEVLITDLNGEVKTHVKVPVPPEVEGKETETEETAAVVWENAATSPKAKASMSPYHSPRFRQVLSLLLYGKNGHCSHSLR